MLKFIIHRRVLISMLFIGLTLTGYISYRNLSVEMLPNVELPFLFVQVRSAVDLDPKSMEKQAVIPLEGAIGALDGIEKIESFANRSSGRIIIYYNSGVNLKYAYLKLQEKIESVKATLGNDFFVQAVKVDTDQLSNMFMNLQVRGGGGSDRIRRICEKTVKPKLEAIDGIANVEVFGGRLKSLEIILNKDAARAYHITPAKIRALILKNREDKTFLGNINTYKKRIAVNLTTDYTDVTQLENIVVNTKGPVLLKDVAEIRFDVQEETSISRVNGMETVTIQLVYDGKVNLIDLAHYTQQVIEKLNKELKSQNVEIVIQQNNAEYLEKNIDLIKSLAVSGGLIAILILWFFLSNIRLVLVIALAMPISILTSFNFFYAFGITLNSLSLVGMALAVGMLLDNSIVVLENIYRLIRMKKNITEAVIQGTQEVWRSIFAATFTTVIVFLPFIFADNYMIRTLGYNIGVSIVSTLFVSLLTAFALIPMATFYFFKRNPRQTIRFQSISLQNRAIQVYILLLKSAMRFPLRTVLWTVTLFFISLLLSISLSVGRQETEETPEFQLYLTMPAGATLEVTDKAVEKLEKMLQDIEEAQDIISQVYEEDAVVTIKLKENYEQIAGLTLPEIKEKISSGFSNFRTADVSFEAPQNSSRFQSGSRGQNMLSFESMLGVGSQGEKIIIKGSDFEIMRRVAEDIEYQLDELSVVSRSHVNVSRGRPEIHLLFDKKLLNSYNISLNNIAGELSAFRKESSIGVNFKQGNDDYEIIIQNQSLQKTSIEDLKELPIPSNDGAYFPLQQISRIIYGRGSGSINRVNQEKQIEISYRFISEINESSLYLETARNQVQDVIAQMQIPTSVAVEFEGADTELNDFYFLLAVAFILIYMILASVFESLVNPFVIMFTIPLAAIGSFWAIIFSGNSLLNANTLIGFLILLGIVVNNGIILIDYTRILRKRGFNRSRALMTAGKARLRPILITAITTIVAMIPLALGKVEYVTGIASPFAVTVIGGLSLGALFTLVYIPTVYSALETLLSWLKGLNKNIKMIQAFVLLGGAYLIYTRVNGLIAQFADLFILLFIIPALTYFIQNSLRRASGKLIATNEPIVITIRNLYKIYGRPSRFIREWRKGEKVSQKTENPIANALWQSLLLLFMIYFVYFYLNSNLWIFILSHFVWFYGRYLICSSGENSRLRRAADVYLWIFPAINLVIFYVRWQNISLLVLIAFLWYSALVIHRTSKKLQKGKININRLSGRFSKLRMRYYRFIQNVPLIGKRKEPFTALNGVSLEIGNGMFGLLGPNGAGKTTLMRIICGILESGYGSVRINGINVKEKREELQGLIGYLPQDFGTYENMSAFEFLAYQAILKNITHNDERRERVIYALKAVGMYERKDDKIGSFSGGMKQRIGIAQTLLHLPRILVVDEPTAGLDPRERIRFRNLLVDLSRDRVVIFSTHIIEDIASSCDRVAVLNKGNVKYLGQPLDMVKLAQDYVWQCEIEEKRFDEMRKKFNIVHHIKTNHKIKIRLLSEKKPLDTALKVQPTLEDAYLWLLSGKDKKNAAS